ncbi:SCP2 sterol-binding domain-containing protein [Candidatus Obscuribacterales bacterium]|nr:SCP2 sterol-binding domain-containing protein [Candidatus Obscuribacterales bacterium]
MMAVFSSTEELYVVMEALWNWIKNNPQISAELLKSKLTVRFHYKNPDGSLTIDGSDGEEIRITSGDCEKKPDIEMFMQSDFAHQFWLGKVNLPLALMSGKIVSKGPVNKALALLPAVEPAWQAYSEIAESRLKRIA